MSGMRRAGSDLVLEPRAAAAGPARATLLAPQAAIAERNNDSQPRHDVLLHDTTKLLFGQKHHLQGVRSKTVTGSPLG